MTEQFLIFDIETVPQPWEDFSESQQEYILRRAATEEEKQQKLAEMALSPMTAQVVCIGLQLMEGSDEEGWEQINRAAFSVDNGMVGNELVEEKLESGDPCMLSNEETMLNNFWKTLKKYNRCQLVSFNGRNFDAPFLMLRSALKGIRPSRNLMQGTKFNYSMHIDLIDELTFYNPSPFSASKRFNFDFYTRAFGIKSPKGEGIDGSLVPKFFAEGKIMEISEYCMRDITATWELFLKWRELLKF